MTNREYKTKPELWAQIKYLKERLQLTERFLEEKGLLAEATEYVENAILELEELPFD